MTSLFRLKKILRKSAGLSLIEMVVYAGIVAVVGVVAVNSTLAMTTAFTDLRVSRDVNASATALFERITRDIRSSYDVDAQSVLGSSPGRLVLNYKNSSGVLTTFDYYVNAGVVNLREGIQEMGAVMTPRTTVTNFVVRKLTNTNSSSKAVKVEATITETRWKITKTRNFYSTVVLRESY